MKKRLISTIIAMTAIVSMTGITANAGRTGNARTAQEYMNRLYSEEWLSKFDEIEHCSWLGWHSPYDASYLRQLENSSICITEIWRGPDYISFAVSNKINETDMILLEEQIKEIDSGLWIYEGGVDNHANPVYGIRGENLDIETKTVKKLNELLKDDVLSFRFTCDVYWDKNIYYRYLTAYPFKEDKDDTQVLEKFISENEINAQIVTYKEGDKDINGNEIVATRELIYVIPADDISVNEHLELAEKIYESTGLAPWGISPDSLGSESTGTTIDVYNAIDGDTNNDGELTVADAAAILQYLGNAEEYPISAQGKFNADIEGDGITAADALAIQRMVFQSGIE